MARDYAAPIILIATFLLFVVPISHGQEYARVRGTVKDGIGAVIRGASVEFRSKSNHYSAMSGNDGAYSARVTPGIYTVAVKGEGFCDGHRAPFSIVANQKIEFHFVLLVNMQASDGGRPRDPGCYNEETLANLGPRSLPPLVQFGAREEKDGSIFYSSVKGRTLPYPHGTYIDEQYPVIFTDDGMTLRADSVIFNSREQSITGIGNATLLNGTKTQRGSKIAISFSTGKAVVAGAN